MAVSAKLLPTACHPVCTGPRGYSSPEAGLSLCGHDVPAHTLLQLVHVSPNHPLVLEVTNVGPWPPQPSLFPSPAGTDAASPSVGTAGPSGSDPGPAVP